MQGMDSEQAGMFSYISAERRVPKDHPLRAIRAMVDTALEELRPRLDGLYARGGRPSIAPEKLLRALLLQVLYSVRSERMLMEQLDYNLLFRWFVGLSMDDPIWDATVFYQEPRAAARGRGGAGLFSTSGGTGAGPGSALDGALHGRWHPDRGLGRPQKLQAPAALGTTTGRSRQSERGLSWRAPRQRHPSIDH